MTHGETGQQPDTLVHGLAAQDFLQYDQYNKHRRRIIDGRESFSVPVEANPFPVDKKGTIIISRIEDEKAAMAEVAWQLKQKINQGKAAFIAQADLVAGTVKHSNGRVGRNLHGEGFERAVQRLNRAEANLIALVNTLSESRLPDRPGAANELTTAIIELDQAEVQRWKYQVAKIAALISIVFGFAPMLMPDVNTALAAEHPNSVNEPFASNLQDLEAACRELDLNISEAIDSLGVTDGFFLPAEAAEKAHVIYQELCFEDGISTGLGSDGNGGPNPNVPEADASEFPASPEETPRGSEYSVNALDTFEVDTELAIALGASTSEENHVAVPRDKETGLRDLFANYPDALAALNTQLGILDIIRNPDIAQTDDGLGGDAELMFKVKPDGNGGFLVNIYSVVTKPFTTPNGVHFTMGSIFLDTELRNGQISSWLIEDGNPQTVNRIITLNELEAEFLHSSSALNGRRLEEIPAGTTVVVITDAQGNYREVILETIAHPLAHKTLTGTDLDLRSTPSDANATNIIAGDLSSVDMVNAGEVTGLIPGDPEGRFDVSALQAEVGTWGTVEVRHDETTNTHNIAVIDVQGRTWWYAWLDIKAGAANGELGARGWVAGWQSNPSRQTSLPDGTPTAPGIRLVSFGENDGGQPPQNPEEGVDENEVFVFDENSPGVSLTTRDFGNTGTIPVFADAEGNIKVDDLSSNVTKKYIARSNGRVAYLGSEGQLMWVAESSLNIPDQAALLALPNPNVETVEIDLGSDVVTFEQREDETYLVVNGEQEIKTTELKIKPVDAEIIVQPGIEFVTADNLYKISGYFVSSEDFSFTLGDGHILTVPMITLAIPRDGQLFFAKVVFPDYPQITYSLDDRSSDGIAIDALVSSFKPGQQILIKSGEIPSSDELLSFGEEVCSVNDICAQMNAMRDTGNFSNSEMLNAFQAGEANNNIVLGSSVIFNN